MDKAKAIITQFPVLKTEQIQLVLTQHSDLAEICALEWAPENSRFVMPYSLERHAQVLSNPDELHLSVLEAESNTLVGFVILAGLQNPHLCMEFRRIVIIAREKAWANRHSHWFFNWHLAI